SEYVVPHTEQIARSNLALAESGGDTLTLSSVCGLWHREGGEFIHISAVEPNGVLHGITRYRVDENNRLQETQFISRAIYHGGVWSLEHSRGSRLTDDAVQVWQEDNGEWSLQLTPEVLSVIVLKP